LKDYPNATFNGFAKRLRPKDTTICPEYAAYYFRSDGFRNKAASMCSIITRASLNNDDLSRLTILYPIYGIQKKIGKTLVNYDLLTINNTNRIQLLEKIAKLIYDEWFVKFKYPGHEKVKMVDSELGKIPERWKVGKIKDLYGIQPGYAFKSKDFCNEGNPIIKIKNIKENKSIDLTNMDKIPKEIADDSLKFKLNKKDLLIAMTGATIGKIGIMPKTNTNHYLNQRVARFLPKKQSEHLNYLYFFITSKNFRKIIENISLGAAQPNISGSYIENINLLHPEDKILNLFCNKIDSVFSLIIGLRAENQNLCQTRDLLLPKLINGQIDISNLDIKVPEVEA